MILAPFTVRLDLAFQGLIREPNIRLHIHRASEIMLNRCSSLCATLYVLLRSRRSGNFTPRQQPNFSSCSRTAIFEPTFFPFYLSVLLLIIIIQSWSLSTSLSRTATCRLSTRKRLSLHQQNDTSLSQTASHVIHSALGLSGRVMESYFLFPSHYLCRHYYCARNHFPTAAREYRRILTVSAIPLFDSFSFTNTRQRRLIQ